MTGALISAQIFVARMYRVSIRTRAPPRRGRSCEFGMAQHRTDQCGPSGATFARAQTGPDADEPRQQRWSSGTFSTQARRLFGLPQAIMRASAFGGTNASLTHEAAELANERSAGDTSAVVAAVAVFESASADKRAIQDEGRCFFVHRECSS